MNKVIYILVALSCILLSSGCNTLQPPMLINVENFDIVNKSDSIYIESDIIIYNPNWHKLVASEMKYSLFIDSTHLGSGVFDEKLLLPSKDSTLISTRFLLNNLDIENFVNLNDSSILTVKCFTSLPIIKREYSFEFNIDLFNHLGILLDQSLAKEDFEIKNINLNSISLTAIMLDFDVEVSNNSRFNYTIDSMNIILFKSKKLQNRIGQTYLSDQFIVAPDSLNQFNVSMQLNSIMMASSLFFKSINKDIFYYVNITGVVVFNNIIVPIDVIKKVEIDLSTMKLKLGK